MLKIKLKKDLRKNILRGHPWVYLDAIEAPSSSHQAPGLCQVLDKKGEPLAWAIYAPNSTLALRILSTANKPPNQAFFTERLQQAWDLRRTFLDESRTNAYRLVNGEGDGLGGLICDIYDTVAVLQFDGRAAYDFWCQDWLRAWLLEKPKIKSVLFKPRFTDDLKPQSWGEPLSSAEVKIRENGCQFLVNVKEGHKTGFFLDQRDNRQYLASFAKGKTLLNVFSYTGGFSVFAGKAGASHVTSLDLSEPACAMAQQNWLINQLPVPAHKIVVADAFQYLKNESQKFDMVMVDPPSMTHSEKTREKAIKNYTDLFAMAADRVHRGGHFFVSSCSSHVNFDDFFEIINESLSKARRRGRFMRVSGQAPDHPFPHFCHELRYLKFAHLVLD